MEQEDLIIDLQAREVQVKMNILLNNRGAAAALDVGFPCVPQRGDDIVDLDCASRPAVSVDDQAVAVHHPDTMAPVNHWVWRMDFPAGKARRLRVQYTIRLRNKRYGTPLFGLETLCYRLTTGALWAGPIGLLNITVKLPVDTVFHITPAGYTRSQRLIQWTLRDHEPEGDLAVSFFPFYTEAYVKAGLARAGQPHGARKGERLQNLASRLRMDRELVVTEVTNSYRRAARQYHLPPLHQGDVPRCLDESARLIEERASHD